MNLAWFLKPSYRCVFVILVYCNASGAETYDFIIVGGGTAGCLLANRLSEVPEWSVLLVEAGGEENFIEDIPLAALLLQLSPANWAYKTEKSSTACLGLYEGRCNWPRGKVLGGSSVINFMAYTRGNSKDYDQWASMGNVGWSYDDVLPYFLKFENMLIPELANDKVYHTRGGDLPISRAPYHTQSALAFVEAAQQIGHKILDYNGKDQLGYSLLQSTLKDGVRASGNTAFLKPIRNRNNLKVITGSQVTKILVDPETRKAYGIEYKEWIIFQFKALARKEIIISAGVINSPQLLMLSGIGPKEHMKELEIPVLQDSKVGYNLQDHISLGNLFFIANDSSTIRLDNILVDVESLLQYFHTHNGTFSVAGGIEAIGFEDIDGDGVPDIELLIATLTMVTTKLGWFAWGGDLDILFDTYNTFPHKNAFMIFPILLHPKSIGRLKLKSKNPLEKPLLYHNYLTDPQDMSIIIEGIRRAINLTETQAFLKHGTELYKAPISPCKQHEFGSDSYWECCVRYMTFTFYHQSGTCKMGPDSDPDAVVDPNLKVRGIGNLRVIDASVMPFVPSGHTVAPTYMIAEKGAAMIKDFWKT